MVRFVERNGQFVVACGCSRQAHNESLLDMFVAEAEVAGVASGAEAAGSGNSAPGVTMFADLLVAQAGLRSALSVPAGACVHVCYASFALHKDAYPLDRALPLVDSHARSRPGHHSSSASAPSAARCRGVLAAVSRTVASAQLWCCSLGCLSRLRTCARVLARRVRSVGQQLKRAGGRARSYRALLLGLYRYVLL